MKRRALELVLLFSLAMNVAWVAAFSSQKVRGDDAAAPAHHDPFAALDLTPEQAEAFAREKADYTAYRGDCHGQMTEMRARLVRQLTAASPDHDAIDRLLVAMRDRQAATERRLVDHLFALRAILRPDQQADFQRVLEGALGGGCKHAGRQCVHAIHEQ